jgi:RNA polymerase sigma factor (sigma-70 family)
VFSAHPVAGDVAGLMVAIRVGLGISQAALGAMTGRSVDSIQRYEYGLRRPPAIFFHDLIEAAPESGLRFNDIATTVGYRPIESADPKRYASIHDFFVGVRVLSGRSRTGFAAILSVPPSHITAVEHSAKPEPDLVRRLARRFLRPKYTYTDVVRRFRTLRPSPVDLRLRQKFRQLRDPGTVDARRCQLREELIRDNIDLARRLAKQEARRLTRPGDAADAWTIALIKAVDGHNPQYGDFIPYLRKWIFGEVRAHARRTWQSGTANELRGMAGQVCQARDELRQRLRREPSISELASHLALPTTTVAEVVSALTARHTQTLDPGTVESIPHTEASGLSAAMHRRLARLDDQLREVVELHFFHNLEPAEIAHHLGVNLPIAKSMLETAVLQLRELAISDSRTTTVPA